MTTACRPPPRWPTRLPAHTRTGHCPRAPRTTEATWRLGSRPHLLYLHHLHPCHPSCSWGPEIATATKTPQTCRKRSFCLLHVFSQSTHNCNGIYSKLVSNKKVYLILCFVFPTPGMNGVLLIEKWTQESTAQSPRVFLNTSLGSPLFWSMKDQWVFLKYALVPNYNRFWYFAVRVQWQIAGHYHFTAFLHVWLTCEACRN